MYQTTRTTMYSEEAELRAKLTKAREEDREQHGLGLGDTLSRVKKYDRLKKKSKLKGVSDKKLKSHLKKNDSMSKHAAKKAARSELLLQEEPGYLEAEGMEKTFKFKQEDIAAVVPLANSQQYFDLKLDTFGPYTINYSRHGRNLLLGGYKGHLASVDWRSKKLGCEFHVYETVRDVQFLHNETMFAVAQKRQLYIYDQTGMELHNLKQHRDVNRLTFLPYHFLLVSADDHGSLRYLDTSVGRHVTEHRTRLGSLRTLTHNPRNAIVHLGHQNGTVTLWSPNVHEPLVKMLCHRGPVTAIAIDNGGWYMATTGMEARLKIWDIRSTYRELHSYYTHRPAVCLAMSQSGLLALGRGRTVEVWKDVMSEGEKQQRPYMKHNVAGEVSALEFCPFEDCMGIGHSKGFASIIVPGAGEPNFDALEANPFQTKKQRQESEVKQLLEKIPSELITLDPDQINKLDSQPSREEEEAMVEAGGKLKNKTRGKSALGKQLHRKQAAKDEKTRALRRERLEAKSKEKESDDEVVLAQETKHVLDRFR